MITNKQYKQDMMYLLKIIRTLYETDGRHIDLESLNKLHISINAIPDKEVYVAAPFGNGVIPVQGFDPNEHEPHDLGNVLHIPNEDDK